MGCSAGYPGGTTPTLSFMSPTKVAASEAGPDSRISVTAAGGEAESPARVDLQVVGLALQLRTGEHPVIEQLELPVADIDIPPAALEPDGLKLRRLRLHVEGPVAAAVMAAEEDALELRAETPLTLSWSLVLDDGSLWALGPTRTQPVSLDLHVVRVGDESTLTVTAECKGECWSIQGVASLTDAALYVDGPAAVGVDHGL